MFAHRNTCHRFGTSSAAKDTGIPPQFPGCFLPPMVQIFGVKAWLLDRQQNDSVVSLKGAQRGYLQNEYFQTYIWI